MNTMSRNDLAKSQELPAKEKNWNLFDKQIHFKSFFVLRRTVLPRPGASLHHIRSRAGRDWWWNGSSVRAWGQPGARCAHNLKVEGKLRIRTRHVEENQEDPSSPVAVKSNHPKQSDKGNVFLPRNFLPLNSKYPATSLTQHSICSIKEEGSRGVMIWKPMSL